MTPAQKMDFDRFAKLQRGEQRVRNALGRGVSEMTVAELRAVLWDHPGRPPRMHRQDKSTLVGQVQVYAGRDDDLGEQMVQRCINAAKVTAFFKGGRRA